MDLREYSSFDGLGLAELVRKREVSARELAEAAKHAIDAADIVVKAVVETYPDRMEALNDDNVADGPFRGVPFLIKDVGGHEKGRKVEFGSRLCKGMVAEYDTNFLKLVRASGLNVLGRSNAPEYSIAGSAENKLYGNTSTPWREGYSAGGSTGGGAAAVAAGLVPLAHGSDIAGSIRIPASWCGGIGLKPSRGRISAGPVADEGGYGLSMNFVQSKTMRDTAVMLDCLSTPQPGDPFVIAKPAEPYAEFVDRRLTQLRIAWTAKPLMDAPVDPEVAAATEATAEVLADMGHHVEEADFPFDGEQASREMAHFWFFGFHLRIDEFARRMNRTVGPDTLEPVVLEIYKLAQTMDPYRFLDALAWINRARREIGAFFAGYDVLVSPTTAVVAPEHGLYGLDFKDMDPVEYLTYGDRPVQFCFPFNVAGAPALSLPLALHSNGLPIGVQLAARPAEDHLVIALGAALEEALPWRDRVPPLHVSRVV